MKDETPAEIHYLDCKGTFNVVLRAEIPSNANILTARFSLTMKHKLTGELRLETRYVIEGYRDQLKAFRFQCFVNITANQCSVY